MNENNKYIIAFQKLSLIKQIILIIGLFFIFSMLFTLGMWMLRFLFILTIGFIFTTLVTLFTILVALGWVFIPLSMLFAIGWLIRHK